MEFKIPHHCSASHTGVEIESGASSVENGYYVLSPDIAASLWNRIGFAETCFQKVSKMLDVTPRIQIPDSEFTFAFARSGGPGGQNVNKVCSKALLTWDVTRSPSIPDDVRERFLTTYRRRITKEGLLLITSQRYRDQGRNTHDCLSKLAELLQSVAVAPTKRKASKPSRGAKQRRLNDKHVRSDKKQSRRRPTLGD